MAARSTCRRRGRGAPESSSEVTSVSPPHITSHRVNRSRLHAPRATLAKAVTRALVSPYRFDMAADPSTRGSVERPVRPLAAHHNEQQSGEAEEQPESAEATSDTPSASRASRRLPAAAVASSAVERDPLIGSRIAPPSTFGVRKSAANAPRSPDPVTTWTVSRRRAGSPSSCARSARRRSRRRPSRSPSPRQAQPPAAAQGATGRRARARGRDRGPPGPAHPSRGALRPLPVAKPKPARTPVSSAPDASAPSRALPEETIRAAVPTVERPVARHSNRAPRRSPMSERSSSPPSRTPSRTPPGTPAGTPSPMSSDPSSDPSSRPSSRPPRSPGRSSRRSSRRRGRSVPSSTPHRHCARTRAGGRVRGRAGRAGAAGLRRVGRGRHHRARAHRAGEPNTDQPQFSFLAKSVVVAAEPATVIAPVVEPVVEPVVGPSPSLSRAVIETVAEPVVEPSSSRSSRPSPSPSPRPSSLLRRSWPPRSRSRSASCGAHRAAEPTDPPRTSREALLPDAAQAAAEETVAIADPAPVEPVTEPVMEPSTSPYQPSLSRVAARSRPPRSRSTWLRSMSRTR